MFNDLVIKNDHVKKRNTIACFYGKDSTGSPRSFGTRKQSLSPQGSLQNLS